MLYLRLAVALVKPALLVTIIASVLALLGVDVIGLASSIFVSTVGAAIDWLVNQIVDGVTFW
jgi:hypothetical protein